MTLGVIGLLPRQAEEIRRLFPGGEVAFLSRDLEKAEIVRQFVDRHEHTWLMVGFLSHKALSLVDKSKTSIAFNGVGALKRSMNAWIQNRPEQTVTSDPVFAASHGPFAIQASFGTTEARPAVEIFDVTMVNVEGPSYGVTLCMPPLGCSPDVLYYSPEVVARIGLGTLRTFLVDRFYGWTIAPYGLGAFGTRFMDCPPAKLKGFLEALGVHIRALEVEVASPVPPREEIASETLTEPRKGNPSAKEREVWVKVFETVQRLTGSDEEAFALADHVYLAYRS